MLHDPTAPDFVVLWAAVRELRYGDYPKLGEARKCAQEMRRWRAAYIAITWVPFTDDSQVQPGRRMRMGERDPEILTIARLRLLGGRANILFSDGAGLDLENAKRKPWEIEA